ncbi:putative protein kinase RLK-Pelle-L-LEC family [Helianthus anomalus]
MVLPLWRGAGWGVLVTWLALVGWFNKVNYIGVGGFGKVYKGEVSHSEGRGIVAIKRLDNASRQGAPEFLKEITMLSDYKHENVISLLGLCCEGGDMILVYELASRGSLDRYLKSPHLGLSIIYRVKNYEQNMLNDITFENPIIKPMLQTVLKRFSGIAYQCLKESREDWPEMSEIVTELESALNIHELL